MQFTVALDRSQNAIVLEIATNRNRSLLLYYVASDQSFVAIEIIQGQVRFSFGGGEEGGTVFRVMNPQLVSDGQWYRVEATREIMVSIQRTKGDSFNSNHSICSRTMVVNEVKMTLK